MCHWPQARILQDLFQPQVVQLTRTTLLQLPAGHQSYPVPVTDNTTNTHATPSSHPSPPPLCHPHLDLIQPKTQACNSSRPRPTCTSSSQGLLCPGSTKAQPTPRTRASSAKSLQLGQPRALALKLMQPKSTRDCLGLDRGGSATQPVKEPSPCLKDSPAALCLCQLNTGSSAFPPVKESFALDLVQPRTERSTPATRRLALNFYRRGDSPVLATDG